MSLPSRFFPGLFVVLWATGFIGARYAMPWAEPFTFLGMRFTLACIIMASLAWLSGSRAASPRLAGCSMIAGILIHGIYLGGVFWAVHQGMPAGLAALIAALQPLLTALLAGFTIGDKIEPKHWAGLALGFAGILIVVAPTVGSFGSGVNASTLTASLLSVLGITLGTLWQKRFGAGIDLLTGTAWQYLGAAVLMILAAGLFEHGRVTFNGELVFALAWLVLVLSVGAIFLLMHMIREGEVARVASLFYLVPVVTALMAWALFGEKLSPLQILGMLLASGSVALSTLKVKAAKRATTPA
ncbi:MAG TPA: DMT family transporter [Rhizobiaceae bacterium]|nr:DMT family transporter [Rhizobiaceae bacterium]